jgi:serine/threonine protein kinase
MTEEEMFHQALALSLPEERAAYLERVCGGDTALRESIEALLVASEETSGFLTGPPPALGARKNSAPRQEPGTVIGSFKLLEAIGEGGMGVVYMAEQVQPVRRKVALKVIKPGMDTKQVIARFEAERQALAMMDHPNIARILDAGATESGRPYFVMELVRGITITEYCDQNRLSIAQRLDLFVLVCQTVQHAHLKGVIHRDLKPSNVLITLQDGTPVPKVIDFGIAKATGQQSLTDKTLNTGFAELMGTPMYLSPEQAELSGIDVDTRSDIYSLGVLLYELLAGTTPFDPATFRNAPLDEVRRIIREHDPPPPSQRMKDEGSGMNEENTKAESGRSRSSFQELDWITLKALEKDRRRRYETAGALAADIVRYRKHEPVEAGPASAWYRGRKFIRRQRLVLTLTGTVVFSLAVVGAIWAYSVVRLNRARRDVADSRAEIARRSFEARRYRYVADIRQAYELLKNGQGPEALGLLNKWQPVADSPDVRNFAWRYLLRLCHDERRTLRGHKGAVYYAEFSPDGRTLVSCGQDGTVRLWQVATGKPVLPIAVHSSEVNAAAFSPDGLWPRPAMTAASGSGTSKRPLSVPRSLPTKATRSQCASRLMVGA